MRSENEPLYDRDRMLKIAKLVGARNWYDLLPPRIAEEQIHYERNCAVATLVVAGLSFVEIARRFSINPSRVRDIAYRTVCYRYCDFYDDSRLFCGQSEYERFELRYRSPYLAEKSPAQKYIEDCEYLRGLNELCSRS